MSLTGMQAVEEEDADLHIVHDGAQVNQAADVLFKLTLFCHAKNLICMRCKHRSRTIQIRNIRYAHAKQ